MPVRFRRTFKILPGVKVNVSKGGISFTVGAKGYHLNFSKRGVRQTVGLPGSGLSQSSYIIKNDSEHETETKKEKDENSSSEEVIAAKQEDPVQPPVSRRRGSPGWVLLLGIVVIYLGALVLGLIPTYFLSQLFDTLTEWTQQMGL
jgi:hypothetical protein